VSRKIIKEFLLVDLLIEVALFDGDKLICVNLWFHGGQLKLCIFLGVCGREIVIELTLLERRWAFREAIRSINEMKID